MAKNNSKNKKVKYSKIKTIIPEPVKEPIISVPVKETVNEDNGDVIKCECGSVLKKNSLNRHMKTTKHLSNLEKHVI